MYRIILYLRFFARVSGGYLSLRDFSLFGEIVDISHYGFIFLKRLNMTGLLVLGIGVLVGVVIELVIVLGCGRSE